MGFSSFWSANAADACIPKDHVVNKQTFFGTFPDLVVGLISNQIFGKMRDVASGDFMDRKWSDGMVYKIYMGIVQDIRFQTVFYLCVVLVIAFLGVSFTLGYSNFSTSELLSHFIKIAIVVFLTTPAGWDTYLELIVKNVVGASRYFNKAIIASMYNVPISQVTSPFAPIDLVISAFTDNNTWNKMLAIFWAAGFLFSIMLLIVFLYTLVTAIIILMKATILYATTIIISSTLLAIGPVFAICILFEKTKTYFTKWLTNLIGIFMQQYLLFLGFFLFCVIMAAMVKGLLYFEACWQVVLGIRFMVKMPGWLKTVLDAIISAINWLLGWLGVRIPPVPEYIINVFIPILKSWGIMGPIFDLPANIFSAGSLFIVSMLFSKFVDSVSDLGTEIAGADLKASDVAKPMTDKLSEVQASATSGFASAAASAMSGKMLLDGVHAAGSARDYLETAAAKREAEGKTGGLTTLMRGTASALSVPAALGKVVQSKAKIDRMRAIEGNQAIAETSVKKQIAKLVGKGKQYKDITEMPDEEKEEIVTQAKAEVRQKGHSGIFRNGQEIPIDDDFVDESMDARITKYMPQVGNKESNLFGKRVGTLLGKGTGELGSNISVDNPSIVKEENIIKTALKGAFVKTDITNRAGDLFKRVTGKGTEGGW